MNEEEKFYIYKHTNKINGKVYIGQTCQKPENRWLEGEGYKGCTYFYHAIQKYGWGNFEHEILFEGLTLEEANRIEEELISQYNSTNSDKGYNLRSGGLNNLHNDSSKEKMSKAKKGVKLKEETKRKIGEGNKGKIVSEETKRKMSEAQKGKKSPLKGKHLSEETRKKISEAQKGEKGYWYGKHFSEEHLKKMKAWDRSIYAKKGENHPMYGKHLSEETKNKISKANKGKKRSKEVVLKMCKPVVCVETGVIYNGVQEIARLLGLSASHITACCKGKRKTCGGYHWEYANKEDD